MDYVLVASPEFVEQYFNLQKPKESLLRAPALKFDQNDRLHERYLEKFFGIEGEEMVFQIMPSVRGFKKFALMGYGYGLIPRIDIWKEIKEARLVEIYPEKTWKTPLYWHYWAIQSAYYQQFNSEIIRYISKKLKNFEH